MAQSVSFNINLKVNGQDSVRSVTMNVDELRRVIGETRTSAERTIGALIGFNQSVDAIRNVSGMIQQVASTLNSLTAESRSFSGAMAAANTMAGKGGEEFANLKNQVAELSKTIPIARDQLANGLYQVISNGVPEDNWISYLEQSAKASVGGIANLEEVVKVTSTVIKNYGLSWEEAGTIQDKIQLAAKNGVTSFEQMAQALPRVTANAATLGVSVNELMATFSTLTGVSGNTAEVSTQLAAVFTALVKPSSEATEMAQQMGIQFDAAAVKAAGGMQNFIQSLDRDVKKFAASSGMLEQEIYGKLFGSAESLRALIPLTGELADKFDENVAAMEGSAGTIEGAFSIMGSTGAAKLQLLNNKLGEYSDMLQATVGNTLPYINFASQVTMSTASALQLVVALRSLNVGTKLASAAMAAFGPIIQVCRATMTGAAVSAQTLKLAIRGLMISTGVGIAIVALTSAIEALTSSSGQASGATDGLDEAERTFQSTAAQTQVAIGQETQKLQALIAAKKDTTEAVRALNEKYGEVFGNHKTAAEWYDTLTKKSKLYAQQLGYEAQMKLLSTQLAEKEIQLQENYDKRRELWKSGGARQTTTRVVGTSGTGGVQTATYQEDTAAYTALKDEARGLLPSISELRKKIDVAAGKMAGISTQINTPSGGNTPTTATTPTTTTTSTPKVTATTTTKKEKPLEGSLDWYEAELQRIKDEIQATADQGVAQAKQGEYEALEQKYNELKIAIGIEKPDTEEAKTVIEQLQASLQEAQRQFDNTNALDIEAKVKAQAKVAEIQSQINKATRGKLTIEAETEPTYVVQGSTADKRQSYSNAQTKASRIQQDYEIGLIGKDEALRQIDELNKELESLGAGLKPIKIDVDTKDFAKAMEKMKDAWGGIQGIGNGVESITDALSGNKDAWQAISGVISGFISVAEGVQAIVAVIQLLTTATHAHTAAKTAEAVATGASTTATATDATGKAKDVAATTPVVAANKVATASFLELASASYFAAHAYIPFAGFGIAADFVSAAVAMTEAVGALAFATGGIVPGTSRSGDKVIARVNSGEMILNAAQQARLFAIANGASVYGEALGVGTGWQNGLKPQDVKAQLKTLQRLAIEGQTGMAQNINLRLRGRDLVGSIANETRTNSRRSNIRI